MIKASVHLYADENSDFGCMSPRSISRQPLYCTLSNEGRVLLENIYKRSENIPLMMVPLGLGSPH